MIPGKWPTWREILFYVFIFIFNSLYVSSTSCSSSGETNCVNTTSGSCHSVPVAVSCARRKWNFRLAHGTATDSYQRLYWHNLSLLMTSTMCSETCRELKIKINTYKITVRRVGHSLGKITWEIINVFKFVFDCWFDIYHCTFLHDTDNFIRIFWPELINKFDCLNSLNCSSFVLVSTRI